MNEKEKAIARIVYKMDALVDILDGCCVDLEHTLKGYGDFKQEMKMEVNQLRGITKRIVKRNDIVYGERQALEWGPVCDRLHEIINLSLEEMIDLTDEVPVETVTENVTLEPCTDGNII